MTLLPVGLPADSPGAIHVDAFCTPPPLPPPRRRDGALLARADRLDLTVDTAGTADDAAEEVVAADAVVGPLAAYAWGAGPTVLLAHGWASRVEHLAALVPPLVDAGCRVAAVDMPGHGRSPGVRSDGSRFKRALCALAAAVGDPPGSVAAVIAHSLGALATVMALADGTGGSGDGDGSRRPGRDGTGRAGRDGSGRPAGALRARRAVLLAPTVRLERSVERSAVAAHLTDRQTTVFKEGMTARFGAGLWTRTAADLLAPALGDVEALIVHDRDDEEVPYAEAAALAAAWPGARLVTTAGLGHRRVLRHAGTVAAAIAFATGGEPTGAAAGQRPTGTTDS